VPNVKEFEGLSVEEVGVEITNAAGGLQEAMKYAPIEMHHGEEHFIVLRCRVRKVRFDPIEKDDYDGPQRRVHVLHADQAVPIAAKLVADHVNKHQEKIKKAKEEAEGVERLPFEDDENRHRVDAETDNPGGDA
jgi:hypothetical protein